MRGGVGLAVGEAGVGGVRVAEILFFYVGSISKPEVKVSCIPPPQNVEGRGAPPPKKVFVVLRSDHHRD